MIISELYHSLIDADDLRKLRRSECLWIQQDGFPVLSHEVLLADVSAIVDEEDTTFEETSVRALGTCALYVDVAETRMLARYKGLRFPVRRPEISGFTVGVAACSAAEGPPDSYNRCTALDRCEPMRDVRGVLIGGAPGFEVSDFLIDCESGDCKITGFIQEGALLPYCWVQAALPEIVTDTNYRLQVLPVQRDRNAEGPVPDIAAAVHTVKPALKVVPAARSLARPLTFWTESTGPGYRSSLWRWTVPLVDGDWQENFSPNLIVSKARVFAERAVDSSAGPPPRVYLPPERITIGQVKDCVLDRNRTQREGEIDVVGCGLFVTPTYDIDALRRIDRLDDEDRLEWVVEFRSFTDGTRRPAMLPASSERLYVEFDVIDRSTGANASAVRIVPPGQNLGRIRIHTFRLFNRLLSVTNEGLGTTTLENVLVEGRDASEFSVRLHSNVSPPFTLRGSESFDISVVVQATQIGQKQANVVVQTRDAGGQTSRIYSALVATADDASLDVLPTRMDFHRGDDLPQDAREYTRNILVSNNGQFALERGAVTLTGSNSGAFTIIGSRYPIGGILDSPAPPTRRVEGGQVETFTVVYHPTSTGAHTAEIRISTDAGNAAIPLRGSCTGSCNYPPP